MLSLLSLPEACNRSGRSRRNLEINNRVANAFKGLGGEELMQLALGSSGPAISPISPRLELGAYEALWLQKGSSFKSLAERFASDPTALPSDFVSAAEAEQCADEVL